MGRRALLVHTDRYIAPQFQNLGGPQQDVDDLENTLLEHCGFRVERYEALNHGDTRESIFQFISDSENAETVLIYFSGHGLVPPGDNRLHLACTNTKPGSMIEHTSVGAGDIRRKLARMSARTVLFLDCCNAGAVNPEDGRGPGDLLDQEVEPMGGDETHVVIAAASKFDVAFEADFSRQVSDQDLLESSDPGIRKTAVFTKFFIDGLKTGDADQDNDGHITAHEAFEWARQRTERHAEMKGRRQKPRFSGSSVSKLVLWKDPDLSQFKPTTIGLLRSEDIEDRHHGYRKLAKSLHDDSPKGAAARRLLKEHKDDLPTDVLDRLDPGVKGSPTSTTESESPGSPTEGDRGVTGEDSSTSTDQAAEAEDLLDRAGAARDRRAAIEIYDQLIDTYSDNAEPAIRTPVAKALLYKGFTLNKSGDTVGEINAYDKLIETYGNDTEPAVREQVAKALLYGGLTLNKAGDRLEAIERYNRLISTYGNDTEPVIRAHVAKALLNKGIALGAAGERAAEIAIYDRIINTYGNDTEPAPREQAAKALLNKADAFGAAGDHTTEIAIYDQLINTYGEDLNSAIVERVNTARSGRERAKLLL